MQAVFEEQLLLQKTWRHMLVLFIKKDLILAIILVAFGAFMYYEAGKFPEAPAILGDTLNADVFTKNANHNIIYSCCNHTL